MKRVVVLGSTGSIGLSALDIVRRAPERLRVTALAAGRNLDQLAAQVREFGPLAVSVVEPADVEPLRARLAGLGRELPEIVSGPDAAAQIARWEPADVVVSAIVGAAGLAPTLAAIRAGRDVALANKETLVMAGAIVRAEAERCGVRLLPVDSEHSAIFQALAGQRREDLRRIVLTASGGPFLGFSAERRRAAAPDEALAHPTWRMGAKISIDSATMMNKGLEVIEAHWLFGAAPEAIDIVIHRQSIIHSMVEFHDGSVLAQMGLPDMRVPLSLALNYPERMPLDLPALDLCAIGSLTFEPPDRAEFPCLGYAYEALKLGGTAPAVLNAANETAVEAYLARRIGFMEIATVIRQTLDEHLPQSAPGLDELLAADSWARERARGWSGRLAAGR
jgi:1-deoxy-D-xylulose-5-phosphate reductoisomerase